MNRKTEKEQPSNSFVDDCSYFNNYDSISSSITRHIPSCVASSFLVRFFTIAIRRVRDKATPKF